MQGRQETGDIFFPFLVQVVQFRIYLPQQAPTLFLSGMMVQSDCLKSSKLSGDILLHLQQTIYFSLCLHLNMNQLAKKGYCLFVSAQKWGYLQACLSSLKDIMGYEVDLRHHYSFYTSSQEEGL
jgi:hypothetical protein